jgi:hypothetical protein
METLVNNGWITLNTQRNGVTVQRAFAGIHPMVSQPNSEGKSTVEQCIVYYHERELYPNGNVIKSELKNYILFDLDYTEGVDENSQHYKQEALTVLTGFVNALGYNGIINPARETLENTTILPVTVDNGYPLHRDTRQKLPL